MKAFVGPAGSGKTYRLMQEVDTWLAGRELAEDEYVLALTRMHGSRRRLIEKLKNSGARTKFRCMTLDHFAWTIASRWRSLANVRGIARVGALDYNATANCAATLLGMKPIAAWVRVRYPLIVVDEFQDCRDGQLKMVQALSSSGELLVAADEFQDLSGPGSPAVAWLTSNGVEELSGNKRTDCAGLLAAATAIRTGQTVSDGKGLTILTALNPAVAAIFLAQRIQWAKRGELVVISPAGPDKSTFVQRVLARVGEKPFTNKKGSTFGPYRIAWHGPAKNRVEELQSALSLSSEDNAMIELRSLPRVDSADGRALTYWAERKARLGCKMVSAKEVRDSCERCVQQSRSRARTPQGVWGTTVHGAKNREFESVVVLWPFQAASQNADRLLYNAITRAKKNAVVIVQENPKASKDPATSRLQKPPFAEATTDAPAVSPSAQMSFPGIEPPAPKATQRRAKRR